RVCMSEQKLREPFRMDSGQFDGIETWHLRRATEEEIFLFASEQKFAEWDVVHFLGMAIVSGIRSTIADCSEKVKVKDELSN
ncbi:MAG: hypothetical protein ACRCYY_21895, partial [Trueperaceae bacterium]